MITPSIEGTYSEQNEVGYEAGKDSKKKNENLHIAEMSTEDYITAGDDNNNKIAIQLKKTFDDRGVERIEERKIEESEKAQVTNKVIRQDQSGNKEEYTVTDEELSTASTQDMENYATKVISSITANQCSNDKEKKPEISIKTALIQNPTIDNKLSKRDQKAGLRKSKRLQENRSTSPGDGKTRRSK